MLEIERDLFLSSEIDERCERINGNQSSDDDSNLDGELSLSRTLQYKTIYTRALDTS